MARRIMQSESRREQASGLVFSAMVLLREGRRNQPWIRAEMRHSAATAIDGLALLYRQEGHEEEAARATKFAQRVRMGGLLNPAGAGLLGRKAARGIRPHVEELREAV